MFQLSKSKHINFVSLHRAAEMMANGFPPIRKRRRLSKIYKILKYFGLTIIALCLVVLILFLAEILSFKQLYGQAILGQHNLEQAIIFAEQDEFNQAMVSAGAAENNFSFLADELGRMKNNRLANQFSFVMNQLNGLESLSVAARFLSKAVYSGASFGKNLSGYARFGEAGENLPQGNKKLNFSEFSSAEKRQVLGKIFESTPELNGIKADLDLAYLNLEQVNPIGALFPLQKKIRQIKNQIYDAGLILAKAVPMSQLLPALAGYPNQAKYLVMLQNNDELRPTGGFLSAYGILHVKDGDLASLNTHDTYYLDVPVQNKIRVVPPEPIKKYLVDQRTGLTAQAGGWYLREANWSPDWPTAAQKIDWFYQKESSLNPAAEKITEFNGVIALTPKLITDFLKILGPAAVQGQVYDQTNFQNLLESLMDDVSSWSKKEVIGEIIKELKIKIFALPAREWSKVINIMADNLATKDLLFYLADKQLENIVLANGWGGESKQTAGDYLMVIDANLGAAPATPGRARFASQPASQARRGGQGEALRAGLPGGQAAKTDARLSRGLEYEITQAQNGLFSKLTLNYAYPGEPSREIGVYKSYTRIYVPLGSRLINLSGYEPDEIDIGDELGKTWFGFYLEVQPGEIKTLIIDYKLPEFASMPKNYEFYLQKQPGKEIGDAKVDLSFLNDIKSYSPVSLYTRKISPDRIRWEGDLNMDRSFEVNF